MTRPLSKPCSIVGHISLLHFTSILMRCSTSHLGQITPYLFTHKGLQLPSHKGIYQRSFIQNWIATIYTSEDHRPFIQNQLLDFYFWTRTWNMIYLKPQKTLNEILKTSSNRKPAPGFSLDNTCYFTNFLRTNANSPWQRKNNSGHEFVSNYRYHFHFGRSCPV